jgi:MoxR-like ATPase
MSSWMIYQGTGEPGHGVRRLPAPPPWRAFASAPDSVPEADPGLTGWTGSDIQRARSYQVRGELLSPINAALHLRRPLMVTGGPGVGKSTLAYAVARELGLRPVLRWTVTSRTTLLDGLYRYDAIGRLQDVSMRPDGAKPDIGRYIRLGPLGTALLPADTPRVLLIDELDKADFDLPNDLLTVFEDGEFEIPELARLADTEPEVKVGTADADCEYTMRRGLVRCRQFPFIVITSNGERDFPPAFQRRCLRVELARPELEELREIVTAHLGRRPDEVVDGIVRDFHRRSLQGPLATDQLLNAIQLTCQEAVGEDERQDLLKLLLRFLDDQPEQV